MLNKLMEFNREYTKETLFSNSSEMRLAEHQSDVPDLLPTQENNVSSADKDTQSSQTKETKEDKFSPTPRKDGESITDYAERVAEEYQAQRTRKEEEAKVDTNPTEAQKEAGNYKKGHIKVDGLDITIEQPKGSIRRGTDANGKQWESEMHNTYGYIRGTESVDGDHIDIFLSDNPTEGKVFVVDQVNKDGSFDEHKVMYGFSDMESARQAYLSNYEEGWQGLGNITEVSKEDFKAWIDSSKQKTKPFAEYTSVKTQGDTQAKKPTEENAAPTNTQAKENHAHNSEEIMRDEERPTKTPQKGSKDNDVFFSQKEYVERKLKSALKQTEYKTLEEWEDKDTEDYSQKYDDLLETYEDYIRDLADDERLQAIYDKSSVKAQKEMREHLTDADLDYHEFINTSPKRIRIQERLTRKSKYAKGEFPDGTIVSGEVIRWSPTSLTVNSRGTLYTINANKVLQQSDKPMNADEHEYQRDASLQYSGETLTNDTEAKQKATKAVLTALNKAGIEVVQVTDEQAQEMLGSSKAEPLKTPQDTVYGWTVNGKIYLTKAGLNPETPVHEYTHLWADAMMKQNKKGWNSIKTLLKDTPVWKEVIGDPNYSDIKDNEDAVASEVLSRISGRKNAAKMEAEAQKAINEAKGVLEKAEATTVLLKLKKALKQFWHWVGKNVFGIKDFKNIDEVTDRVLYDLLNSTDLNSGTVTTVDGVSLPSRINVVEAEANHGFKNFDDGRKWAKENIARTYDNEETNRKGNIRVSNTAIDKFMSEKAVAKSESKNVHMAVLKVLPDVIRESVDAEQHEDRIKDENGIRKAGNAVNPDMMIHRLYGAVDIAGKIYRVKVTLKENVRTKETPKAYSYEATKIELLSGQSGDVTMTSPRNDNNSILTAKLLKDIEKSYGKGVKLLKDDKSSYPRFQIVGNSLSDEEKKIVETAKANGTYMKAPNGKPTNLSEKQWAQVRTKAFKNWFGDWEKAARIEKLRRSKAVKITEADYGGKYELTRNSAKQWAKDNIRGEYTIADTGEKVNVSKVSINEVLSHGERDAAHLKSISSIGKLLHNAIFIAEAPNAKDNDKYESYRYYVEGIKIDGVNYTAKLVIGVKNGKTYYDHRLTQIEKGSLLDSLNGLSNSVAEKQKTSFTGKDSKLLSILQTNSSKVVDENGEPMVAYHGSNNEFTKFDTTRIGSSTGTSDGRGFYFTTDKDYANSFGKDGNVLSVFLNIDNPLSLKEKTITKRQLFDIIKRIDEKEVAADGEHWFISNYANYYDVGIEGAIREAAESEYPYSDNDVELVNSLISASGNFKDVVNSVYEITGKSSEIVPKENGTVHYVVTNPNQIKSATGNNGNFSTTEDDILYRTIFGGNSGYVGYSMSKRAAEDKEEDSGTNTEPTADIETLTEHAESVVRNLHLDNVEIVPDGSSLNGRQATAKGFYNKRTGKIVVVAGNHTDIADIEKTVLHEAVAHYGLRELFGNDFDKFLDTVFAKSDIETRRQIAHLSAKHGWNVRTATEEYLASMAEDTNFEQIRPTLWQRIKQLFGEIMSAFGLHHAKLTDNDLRYMLWRSYKNLQGGGKRSILDMAEDIATQYRLKVGNHADKFTNELNAVNERFNEELSNLTEENADKVALWLGKPSKVLLAAGVEDKPMKLYGNKVIRKMKKHGFSLEELRNLPRAVADPVAVFNNYQREGNRSILTELMTQQGNFLVSVNIGKDADVDFNIVRSVFGKGNENVVAWINNGLATYINKEKALSFLSHQSAPIAATAANAGQESSSYLHFSERSISEASNKKELSSAAKIIKDFHNPKLNSNVLYRSSIDPTATEVLPDARTRYEKETKEPDNIGSVPKTKQTVKFTTVTTTTHCSYICPYISYMSGMLLSNARFFYLYTYKVLLMFK